jgi:hypothetical protein
VTFPMVTELERSCHRQHTHRAERRLKYEI